MAFLQINFYSKSLKRLVNFNAILPVDTVEIPGIMEAAPDGPMRSIYLLHGYSGGQHDWICGSKIQELALKHNVAVFMPTGDNSFYIDDTDMGALYGEFVGKELVEITRKMFHLSDKKEDTFIGGLSMGGYGAIRNGLKYSDTFGRIIALSSALITYNIAGIPEDYKDPVADYKYYTRVFGDLNKLIGSDKDPEAIAHNLKESGKDIPKIYMACGTEDFLLNENRKYHNFLTSENIEHTYEEDAGIHDWTFWNKYIEKALEWAI